MEGIEGAKAKVAPGWAGTLTRALALAALTALVALSGAPVRAQGGDVIGDVVVEGNRRVATQRILRMVRSQPGSPFSKATLQEDVAQLGSSRLFRNVGAREEQLPDGRIRLVLVVS